MYDSYILNFSIALNRITATVIKKRFTKTSASVDTLFNCWKSVLVTFASLTKHHLKVIFYYNHMIDDTSKHKRFASSSLGVESKRWNKGFARSRGEGETADFSIGWFGSFTRTLWLAFSFCVEQILCATTSTVDVRNAFTIWSSECPLLDKAQASNRSRSYWRQGTNIFIIISGEDNVNGLGSGLDLVWTRGQALWLRDEQVFSASTSSVHYLLTLSLLHVEAEPREQSSTLPVASDRRLFTNLVEIIFSADYSSEY